MKLAAAALACVLTVSFSVMTAMAAKAGAGTGVNPPKKDTPKETPKGTEGKEESFVGRFVKADKGSAWGHACMVVSVAPAAGGGAKSLAVPNQKPESPVYDPAPSIANVVKDLKKGDYVKVTVAPFMGMTLLKQISAYTLKPGEDEPDCFVFEDSGTKEVDKQTFTTVTLSRFGGEQTVLIPKHKNDKGEQVDDAKLAEAVSALKKGDVVEATVQKAGQVMLKSIAKYEPPVRGEVVKIVDKVGETGLLGIEVKIDGGAKTLLVPNVPSGDGRSYSDPKLAAAVRSLKAGDACDLRARTDGDKTYLTHIAKAKKEAEPKKGD